MSIFGFLSNLLLWLNKFFLEIIKPGSQYTELNAIEGFRQGLEDDEIYPIPGRNLA